MAESTTDISDDPPWINEDSFQRPRFVMDPRCDREVIAQLGRVLLLKYGHRPKKWGFAIVRTAYGPASDEQFQHALTLIGRIAQVYTDAEAAAVKSTWEWQKKNDPVQLGDIPIEVDLRPGEEIVRRYENDVLEDAAQLEGASVATVREYFNNWIVTKHGTSVAGDMRFATCILLDAETLAQLATAPDDFPPPGNTGFKSTYWVKMVEAAPKPEDAFRARVFGHESLIRYWFTRNHSRRSAIESIHNRDPKEPGIWYYGSPPPDLTFYSPPP